MKYLGINLDSRLTFGHHVERKIAESTAISKKMWPLIGNKSPLPVRTKVALFLAIVHS